MDYRAISVGPIETDCYIVFDAKSKTAAIIDPGDEQHKIAGLIDELNLNVEWVLLTHGHIDHVYATQTLAKRYGASVAMHPADSDYPETSLQILSMFYDVDGYVPFKIDKELADGDIIELGDSIIEVMHTPGHSPGGVCFLTDAGVFCGDLVFAGSIGRTDLPGGSLNVIRNSIETRILSLDDGVAIFPGHGPATSVGVERNSNPYF